MKTLNIIHLIALILTIIGSFAMWGVIPLAILSLVISIVQKSNILVFSIINLILAIITTIPIIGTITAIAGVVLAIIAIVKLTKISK